MTSTGGLRKIAVTTIGKLVQPHHELIWNFLGQINGSKEAWKWGTEKNTEKWLKQTTASQKNVFFFIQYKTDETGCLVHFCLRIDHIGTGSSESFLSCCQMLCESFLNLKMLFKRSSDSRSFYFNGLSPHPQLHTAFSNWPLKTIQAFRKVPTTATSCSVAANDFWPSVQHLIRLHAPNPIQAGHNAAIAHIQIVSCQLSSLNSESVNPEVVCWKSCDSWSASCDSCDFCAHLRERFLIWNSSNGDCSTLELIRYRIIAVA